MKELLQESENKEPELFFGSILEHTDKKVNLILDFIRNFGLVHTFACFMERRVLMTDEGIFNDTSETKRNAFQIGYNRIHNKTEISKTAFKIALRQLLN